MPISGISWNRSILSYGKVQRLISTVIRNRAIFMNRKIEGLVINVGCGPNAIQTCINLDYRWNPGVDVCCDITKGLPFDDGYASGVFTEHCLEHISFDETLSVLKEFHRVMRQSARLRIVVPDFEIYVDSYNRFRETGECTMPYAEWFELRRKDRIYSPAMSVNRIFRSHGHKFIYDFATLREMLRFVGFSDIRKMHFREGTSTLIFDAESRKEESLYLEALRP